MVVAEPFRAGVGLVGLLGAGCLTALQVWGAMEMGALAEGVCLVGGLGLWGGFLGVGRVAGRWLLGSWGGGGLSWGLGTGSGSHMGGC